MKRKKKSNNEKQHIIFASKVFRNDKGVNKIVKLLLEIFDNAPTVDAVPVVHGKWIWDTKGLYPKPLCSRCSEEPCRLTNHQSDLPKYCPHCGAKMDL